MSDVLLNLVIYITFVATYMVLGLFFAAKICMLTSNQQFGGFYVSPPNFPLLNIFQSGMPGGVQKVEASSLKTSGGQTEGMYVLGAVLMTFFWS